MITVRITVPLPDFIGRLADSISLFCRRIRYGYAFRLIPLTEGKFAIVDADDYHRLAEYSWGINKGKSNCYAARGQTNNSAYQKVLMHREVIGLPDGIFVDHINGNTLDNRKANLRPATTIQNNWNRKKARGNYSSRFKGVSWRKPLNKWQTRITCMDKTICLGYFNDEEAAAKAYDAKARELFGQFARLNFPEKPPVPVPDQYLGCLIETKKLKSLTMTTGFDKNKIVRQHAEMDKFFTGGMTLKSKKSAAKTSAAGSPNARQNYNVELELKNLADEIDRCRKCELGSLRKNSVPGQGNPEARIMFIGEGPGADEDEQGLPFVGRAGQLLDKIITAMGLKRTQVYICNIIKCRPPENRDPKPDEITSCLPYLQKQIELIQPEIIVALGAHAARTLLDTQKTIGELRGRFIDYYPGLDKTPKKLMPTYHPAYLLRNYSDNNRARVWEDMKKVLEELGLPIPKSSKK